LCYLQFKVEHDETMTDERQEIQIKRPNPEEILNSILEKYDFSGLRAENKGDAVKASRENRWGDDL
jgi:hypothetical protein